MLPDRKPYQDLDLDHDQLSAQRNQRRWVRALRKAGLLPVNGAQVASAPAAAPQDAT